MKNLLLALVLFVALSPAEAFAQDHFTDFRIEMEELTISDLPALQSYIWAEHDGKYLILGGRTDGLHKRRPFEAFLVSGNNAYAYVIDPIKESYSEIKLEDLPTGLFEQLRSTNMQFVQDDSFLIACGGYGYSSDETDHTTFKGLIRIDIGGLIDVIENNKPQLSSQFEWIEDNRLQVTGGQLKMIDNTFYLVGGQKFLGRYNPMGPDHGPGFTQEYSNSVKRFTLSKGSEPLKLLDFSSQIDTILLHKRDYNLIKTIENDGKESLVAYSGVFQYTKDLPWLESVQVDKDTFLKIPSFEQKLNQYHSANAALYSKKDKINYHIFFGGMGQFYFDESGKLVEDDNVPFVKTISMSVKDSNGMFKEFYLDKMDKYLGSSAEFWPNPNLSIDHILDLDAMNSSKTFIGYIYGGIESQQRNSFFNNSDGLSWASDKLYKVYLIKDGLDIQPMVDDDLIRIQPNPSTGTFNIRFSSKKLDKIQLYLTDINGKLVFVQHFDSGVGENEFNLDLHHLPKGFYNLTIKGKGLLHQKQLSIL